MEINKITIIGGIGKLGQSEKVARFDLPVDANINIHSKISDFENTLNNMSHKAMRV